MLRNTLTALLIVFAGAVALMAADPTAWVINTSDETLSKINLTTDDVTNNILDLGTDINCYPNQIIVRDTLAYVLLSGTDEIQIINLVNETTAGWIGFPTGSNPYGMAFLDDLYLYVTLLVDNSLAKVDLDSRQVILTTPIGTSPEGIIIYDNKAFIAITAYDFGTWSWGDGKVVVYDTQTEAIIDEIPTSTNPQYLELDRHGKIHVVCTGDYWDIPGAVYRINPETDDTPDIVEIGGQPAQIAISPDDNIYLAAGGWVDDGEVYSYDAQTLEIYHDPANPIYVDSGATGVVAFQDSTALTLTFGDRIIRIGATGETRNTYVMGDGPVDLDFNYLPGDANGDFNVNVGDAVYLINYIFKNGTPAVFPFWRGNPNGDNSINVGDAVYLINYVFKDGTRPKIGPTWVK